MVWTLDGPFATADYSYRLTSPQVQFDDTGFVELRAEGRGRLSPWPMRVPMRLSARAITGIGDVAGAMLANPRIEGWLTVTPKLVRGDGLKLTSAKWNGKMSLLIDLVTGRFEVTAVGRDAALPDPRARHRRRDHRPARSCPGPNNKGIARRRHRQGLGAAARQQLLPRPDRRPAVARPPTSSAATTASSISPTCSSIRPSCGCRAPGSASATARSTSSRRAGRRNTARSSWSSTAISSGPGSTCSSTSPNEALGHHATCGCCSMPTAGGLRLSRQRRLEARAVHQQRPDPAAARTRRRSSPSPRSMPAARMRAAICAPIPAGSPAG